MEYLQNMRQHTAFDIILGIQSIAVTSGNEYTTQTICSTLFLHSHWTQFDRNKKHTPPNSNKEENIWTIQRTAAVQFRNSCDIQWVPSVCLDKYGMFALSQMTLWTNKIFCDIFDIILIVFEYGMDPELRFQYRCKNINVIRWWNILLWS